MESVKISPKECKMAMALAGHHKLGLILMLISTLSLSKTQWCFSIRRLSLVTSCTIINLQFYTGHSRNFLRVENGTMAEKWTRPSLVFYKCISEFPAISRKRICERKPEVLGTFEAERIVAKNFVKGKPQYVVNLSTW